MSDQVEMTEKQQKAAARKLSKALKSKTTAPISDPMTELRQLVQQDKSLTKTAVAIEHMSSDRTSKESGDVIACRLPKDTQEELHAQVESIRKKRAELESVMAKRLKGIPIYELFLKKVFGLGTLSAAYFVTEIDIHKAARVSNLRRFCGMMVDGGRLEGRTGQPKSQGGTGTYNKTMRTRLFLLFSSMRKCAGSTKSCKYMDVWNGYKHRVEHSDRVFDRGVDKPGGWTGKITKTLVEGGKTREQVVSARGFADSTGWHKAADVLLEDLYVVWRAIEGLPVWPSYYAAKLGYEHGGKICVNAPKMLTVEEALAIVGNVGSYARHGEAE